LALVEKLLFLLLFSLFLLGVTLALVLFFPLLIQDFIDTVLKRGRPVIIFECVPDLDDGILELDSELILSHLHLVVVEVKVVENIIDSDFLLHKEYFTFHTGEYFAQIVTTSHHFRDHLRAEHKDRDFILAEIVGINFVLHHERSVVNDRATLESLNNEGELLGVVSSHDVHVARLNQV
jgi:hypothetical protein